MLSAFRVTSQLCWDLTVLARNLLLDLALVAVLGAAPIVLLELIVVVLGPALDAAVSELSGLVLAVLASVVPVVPAVLAPWLQLLWFLQLWLLQV